MRNYRAIFLMEGRRFFCLRNIILVCLVYMAALLLSHSNIVNYRDTLVRGRNFQSVGRLKFEKMLNYNNYSLIGIKSLFMPSPLAVLYNSVGAAYDWKGRVDTIAGLEIDKNSKGRAAFQEEAPFSPFRYVYIILIAGGLLASLYGFGALRNIEYSRFLSGYVPPGHIFTGIIVARALFITLCMALLSGLVLLLFHVEEVALTAADMGAFWALAAAGGALLLFFFAAGLVVGRIKSIIPAWTVLLTGWFSLALLLPAALTLVANNRAAKITDSDKVELDQLSIIVDYETRAENDNGKFDRENIDSGRKVIESYWDKDYKSVEKLETDLRAEVAQHMEGYRDFSRWIPITFYLAVGKDVGGKGPDNYLGYYDFLITLKRNFLRFFIDRCFYHNPLEMVNFIRADENLFYARGRIPPHFWTGLLTTFLYIFLLLAVSFFWFKKSLYRLGKEAAAGREKADIRLLDHEVNACYVEGEEFNDLLFASLSGRRDVIRESCFTGSLWVDETDILGQVPGKNQPPAIVYMPRPRDLPGDINARGLVSLVCRLAGVSPVAKKLLLDSPAVKTTANRRFKRLKTAQIFQVMLLLAPLKESRYYLIHDMAGGLPLGYAGQLMEMMERLNDQGGVVIFLTASGSILEAPIEEGRWFGEGGAWTYQVKAFLQARKAGKKG